MYRRRLTVYRWLAKVMIVRGYVAKVMLATFVGIHIPLIITIGILLAVTLPNDRDLGVRIAVIATAATVAGALLTLVVLYVLLVPVALASRGLRRYRMQSALPNLPTDITDEAGQLLSDVQETLEHADGVTRTLADRSLRDPLTGLGNRRAGEALLAEDLRAVERLGGELTLLSIDVDGLKQINDRHGHPAGDHCLAHLARHLQRQVKGHGWVVRWAGDEFVAGIHDAPGDDAGESIRRRLEADPVGLLVRLTGGEEVAVAYSVGHAVCQTGESITALLKHADTDLYRAKKARVRPPGAIGTGTASGRARS